MSGSGISWAICKSAPCSRQITMPARHHSVFLHAGYPPCRLTNSVSALKAWIWNGSIHSPQINLAGAAPVWGQSMMSMLPCYLPLVGRRMVGWWTGRGSSESACVCAVCMRTHLCAFSNYLAVELSNYMIRCEMVFWTCSRKPLCGLVGVMVRMLAHDTNGRCWLPAVLLSGNNFGQVVHTRASVTKQYNWYRSGGSDVLRLGR